MAARKPAAKAPPAKRRPEPAPAASRAISKDMLEKIGLTLYGTRWQTELANATGISPRFMRFLTTGERPVSGALSGRLRELIDHRRQELAELAAEVAE